VFSFGTAVYGATSGWCTVTADYLVYQPTTRPTVTIYLYTFLSLLAPIIFSQLLGLAIMTATVHDPLFQDAYETGGIGAVLTLVLVPPLGPFGEVCLVMFAFTIITNNAPPIYPVSFSLQLLSRWFQRVPRPVWPLVATGAYIAIATPAYDHFAA
jgi:purine-cytosine permease-like protein